MNKPESWEDENDYLEEKILDEFCPCCVHEYDEIDYERQVCHICNFNNNLKRSMNEEKKKEFEDKFPLLVEIIKAFGEDAWNKLWLWIDSELKQARIDQCNKIFELAKENKRFGQMHLFALGDILSIVNTDFIKQLEKEK